MSKLTEALIGREPEKPKLSPDEQQILEAFESNPFVIQEGKKRLIELMRLALKMDSVNSIKHMIRTVVKSMDPQPNPFDKDKDKDAPPEPPAKRPPAVKVPPAVPSAAPAAA